MTFIAGFQTSDGILLCADSEFSGAGTKKHDQKLFTHVFAGGVVAFALSGSDAGQLAIEVCREQLEPHPHKQYTEKAARKILREAVRSTHAKYVDSRRTKATKERAQFELIVAVAMPGSSPAYLMANNAGGPELINVGRGYDCKGSGWWAGEYVAENTWRRGMKVDQCVICALRALNMAKRHAEGVSGNSQFISIRNGVLSDVVPHDSQKVEELIEQYEVLSSGLLIRMGDPNAHSRDFKESAVKFANAAVNMQADWAAQSSEYRDLLRSLATPAAAL